MSVIFEARADACARFARYGIAAGMALSLAILPVAPAGAELAVSQLVVELKPGMSRAADIEIFNDSDERSFVAVEPREILDAGLAGQRPLLSPDPEKLGLLVSPTRLVIEPHQRKRLRIAAIGPLAIRERVYRVTVKPVAGEVSGSETGLKLLVGYDLLVLVRPPAGAPRVDVSRNGTSLAIVNRGNASVELAEGRQCDTNGANCSALPGKRLYAGATWQQSLPQAAAGEYRIRSGDSWSTLRF